MSGIGHNGMTRDEWLYAILQSGEVTRISQHLALVIYHLSDPATNSAKLSARDLERITGWGRTAIIEHIDELEIYIRVKWGQGRAKALFEMQGVIAEAVKPLQTSRHTDTTADTRTDTAASVREADATVDTTADTTVVATQADTMVDTTADTNSCGRVADHKNADQNGVVSASRTQAANGGDYRGGTTKSLLQKEDRRDSARAKASGVRTFVITEDGRFLGTAFEEFTQTEIAAFHASYPFLDIMAELANADRFLARVFEQEGVPFEAPQRLDRLHSLLSKKNRELQIAVAAQIEARKQSERAETEKDSCWFEGHKLMVANGFKAELLEAVSGDEAKLRTTLDVAAKYVPHKQRGDALKISVVSAFHKTLQFEPKTKGREADGESSMGRMERLLLAKRQKANGGVA